MKVIIYFLISLTITLTIFLMLPSLASADTIIFKDGKKVHVGRTWKEDGQVKWATSGITIGYPEEDIERVEKTPIEEDSIGTRPIKKKRIKKGIKFSKHQTRKTTIQNPPYFGMEKWQYNLCIALGKKVMSAQRRRPDSPQHKAAYKEWDINCGMSVFFKLSEKHPQLSHVPASPLDWANLKSYRVPQPTRKTTIQKQSKRSINPNPIAKVPRSKAKSDIKGKLAQKYAGSYSLQKTLLGQHMKSYDYLISLPSNAVNNQILSKLMGRYYPHFSLIKTLYEHNIKAYRELQN